MKLTVGKISIEGPDSMNTDEFGKLIDVVLLRMNALVNYDVTLETATAIAAIPATTTTSATPVE
jgi:hypothetical protein